MNDDTAAKVMIALGEYLKSIGRNTESGAATSQLAHCAGMHIVAMEADNSEVQSELLDQFATLFPDHPFETLRRFDQMWGSIANVAINTSQMLLEFFPLPPDVVTIEVRPADVRALIEVTGGAFTSDDLMTKRGRVAAALDKAVPVGRAG